MTSLDVYSSVNWLLLSGFPQVGQGRGYMISLPLPDCTYWATQSFGFAPLVRFPVLFAITPCFLARPQQGKTHVLLNIYFI